MKKDMCILRDKGKRKLFIVTIIVLVLGIMVATCALYLGDYYRADERLVLLGSYSTVDLSDTDLDVLSVYGSEDNIMNREKYDENKSNLPSDVTEIVINGGCHAYFGMYGEQEREGIPSITVSEQTSITVDNIVKMMKQE